VSVTKPLKPFVDQCNQWPNNQESTVVTFVIVTLPVVIVTLVSFLNSTIACDNKEVLTVYIMAL